MSSYQLTRIQKNRRNGQLQACEPCRTRKVRCDHGSPSCGRCVKRHQETQCYYHPAPLSQESRTQPPVAIAPISNSRNETTQLLSPTDTTSIIPTLNDPGTAGTTTTSTTANRSDGRSRTSEVAYLGSTSFSEVFKANEHTSDHVWLGPLTEVKRSLRTPAHYRLSPERLSSGAHILGLIVEHSNVRKTLETYYTQSSTVVIPWITLDKATDSIIKTLRENYHSETRRIRLVENIFAKTGEPLQLDEQITAGNFHENFTGPNLRWEILGILFTYLALGTEMAEIHSKQEAMERRSIVAQYVHASNTCVSFCDRAESLNDLLVWL